METTLVAGVTYTYNKYEVIEKINETIEFIENIIAKNQYQVSGDIGIYKNLEDKWIDLSMNQMKKIQRYCFWIERNPSLKKINTFFSLLSRLFKLDRVHVKPSLKEEAIQKARKEWLKARNEADRLLKIYKDEKGDFYKK